MRMLPQSLFARLALTLGLALSVAQLVSAWVHYRERGHLVYDTAGLEYVDRIAGIVRLLDPMSPGEREKAVEALGILPLHVELEARPWPVADPPDRESGSALMDKRLRELLGADRPVRVRVERMRGPYGIRPPGPDARGPDREAVAFRTRVRLIDGVWVSIDQDVPAAAFEWPAKLFWSLLLLLVSVVLVSLVAVRWITRPLARLSQAAEALGHDINQPPLEIRGPSEVRRAAQAFNTMQSRLKDFIEQRTRTVAAISHDLKTPLTRMRLRTEMCEDEELREKFRRDLDEMKVMVQGALDYLSGIDSSAEVQPVDIDALLESLQADREEGGRAVRIDGAARGPYPGRPLALKRALANLVDNALRYGRDVSIGVDDDPRRLTISVRDRGPGIPQGKIERVMEPFYRLEGSRSRETGGSGLGLSIARAIARSHGGELELSNRAGGGLEALLTLPRGVPETSANPGSGS